MKRMLFDVGLIGFALLTARRQDEHNVRPPDDRKSQLGRKIADVL